MRKVIFHADDLGMSKAVNEGVFQAHRQGLVTSTCIMTNGPSYDDAIVNILPECPDIGLGLHINLTEGKSDNNYSSVLWDTNGNYRGNFLYFYRHRNSPTLAREVESEIRHQIETLLRLRPIDHINSHHHVHAIPFIFEIVCKLAKEYQISFVRLPKEYFYVVKSPSHIWAFARHSTYFLKHSLLNRLAQTNQMIAKTYGVQTNNALIGILYTGLMTTETIIHGLEAIPDGKETVEILVHPASIFGENTNRRFKELQACLDLNLCHSITKQSWQLVNYQQLSLIRVNPSKVTA